MAWLSTKYLKTKKMKWSKNHSIKMMRTAHVHGLSSKIFVNIFFNACWILPADNLQLLSFRYATCQKCIVHFIHGSNVKFRDWCLNDCWIRDSNIQRKWFVVLRETFIDSGIHYFVDWESDILEYRRTDQSKSIIWFNEKYFGFTLMQKLFTLFRRFILRHHYWQWLATSCLVLMVTCG